eukprot:1740124-Rhodomonas_salina.2
MLSACAHLTRRSVPTHDLGLLFDLLVPASQRGMSIGSVPDCDGVPAVVRPDPRAVVEDKIAPKGLRRALNGHSNVSIAFIRCIPNSVHVATESA